MDPRLSPYSPGAGTRPEVLAGRTEELDRFSVLIDRLGAGRSGEPIIFAGSSGMGKTVLLRECDRRAGAAGWFTAYEEVDAQSSLRSVMALTARKVLLEMSASRRYGDRVKRALGVLKAFTSVGILGVSVGIDVEAIKGTADTGLLRRDLLAVFTELGQVVASDSSGVVFFLDELHTLRQSQEMEVLDSVIHAMAQQGLPVTAIGAGVFPTALGFEDAADNSSPSTYGGRLYRVIRLRPLLPDVAARWLTEPAARVGVMVAPAAVNLGVGFAEGSPWVLQLLGEAAWEQAAGPSEVSETDMGAAIVSVRERLDGECFPRLLRGIDPTGWSLLRLLAHAPQGFVDLDEAEEREELPRDVSRLAIKQLAARDILSIVRNGSRQYQFAFPGVRSYVIRNVG
jgi:hypothetical protein